MKTGKNKSFVTGIFLVLMIGILYFFLNALSTLDQDQAAKDKRQLEDVLTRAAVACYATEGVYPPNLEYLVEHYGVQINEDLYSVKYMSIASNLMPDITVLDAQP